MKNRGLDLDKVHRATKIQEKYIAAIEEGNDKVFSAEIYYKSFVKSYSKFLGIDGEALLEGYESRKKGAENAEKENKANGGASSRSPQKSSVDVKKLLLTIMIAACLCGVFIYLNKNISFLIDDNGDQSATFAEQQKEFLKKQQEMRRARQQLNRQEQAAAAAAEQKSEETKALKPFPQSRDIKVSQTAASTAKSSAAVTAPVHVPSAMVSSPAASAAVPEKQKLRIEAVRECVDNG